MKDESRRLKKFIDKAGVKIKDNERRRGEEGEEKEDNRTRKELKVNNIRQAGRGERMDKESKKGRMADALALGGDEGRDKLR